MRKIYFDSSGKIHSLYKELIFNPPEGYTFITDKSGFDSFINTSIKIPFLYTFQEQVLNKFLPVNLMKAFIEKKKKIPENTYLTYSPGHIVFRNEPWVVDLEFITQLTGYSIDYLNKYKFLIEKYLSSNNCKRVICWTNACKKTLFNNLNCETFKDKIELVYLSIKPKKFIKKYNENEKIKLLFVGSSNILGEFEYKGGKEIILAFKELKKEYSDIELVIRSDIPKIFKEECKKIKDITIYDKIISSDILDSLFKSSDIFWFPTYATPGIAILDAMSYELPIITTDVWANTEMVEDGINGLIIKKRERIKYYTDTFIPLWNYNYHSKFMKQIAKPDKKIINELVEKTRILLDNKQLRIIMGKKGRQEIENGKFSILERNKKFKKIFDNI